MPTQKRLLREVARYPLSNTLVGNQEELLCDNLGWFLLGDRNADGLVFFTEFKGKFLSHLGHAAFGISCLMKLCRNAVQCTDILLKAFPDCSIGNAVQSTTVDNSLRIFVGNICARSIKNSIGTLTRLASQNRRKTYVITVLPNQVSKTFPAELIL